jgi:adenylate cyclase class 2
VIIDKEIEIKLECQNFADVEKRIKKLGFSLLMCRSFEKNLVFDNESGDLVRKNLLLRLRQQGNSVYLTFKKPRINIEGAEEFKVRDEIEIEIDNFREAENLLRALNYHIYFTYEKYRTTYGCGKLKVMFDETPIGNFVEIEGPPDEIIRLADALGFQKEDFLKETYYDLFSRHQTGENMCFQ